MYTLSFKQRYDIFLSAVFLWHGCCPGQCAAVKSSPEAEWEPSSCFTSKTELPAAGRLKSRAAAVTGALRTVTKATHHTPLWQHGETGSVQWKSIRHRNTAGLTDMQNNESETRGADKRPAPRTNVATTCTQIVSRAHLIKLTVFYVIQQSTVITPGICHYSNS